VAKRKVKSPSRPEFDKWRTRHHDACVTAVKNIMRSRQTTFSPLLRSLAATTLLVWVMAQVLCFAHCNFGFRAEGMEKTSGHAAAKNALSHGGSCCPKARDNSNSPASTICSTLKSALTAHGAVASIPPDLHLLYTLVPLAFTPGALASRPTVVSIRQTQPHDWAFTPEVGPGPAHRSHAPPLFS
jgi:hypothetical protein